MYILHYLAHQYSSDSMVATLYKPTQSVPITNDNCKVNCVS